MKAKRSGPRIIGYEILRRVEGRDVPGHAFDPRTERGVLGAQSKPYVVPPGVDVFELGLIERPGSYEMLPIDEDGKPLWDDVVHMLVTRPQAERQRGLLLRAYRALRATIREADQLEASVAEWSGRREAHPVFGMLRLTTIDVWASLRPSDGPLSELALDALHAEVARRVAARIRAPVVD